MTHPIEKFTSEIPFWRPRVSPVELEDASQAQLDAMKTTLAKAGVNEYLRVLALDPETLRERTPLFNGIMYGRGELARSERELSAVAASVVNHCVYCAAVHSYLYNQLTKDETVTAALFEAGDEADLEPRPAAIVRFAARLARCPAAAGDEDVQRLADNGLGKGEIFDVVLCASVFSWANRLMHTLGDPVPHST